MSTMRFVIAVVACFDLVPVQGFPGSMLRGRWPPMRVPPEIQQQLPRLPESKVSLPEVSSPFRLSLPDVVRNAVMCCKDMSAECMACATHQDVTRFCTGHAGIPGCQNVLEKAREHIREKALDGVVNSAVERLAEKIGGTRAEKLVDEYLEKNPGVARKNIANMTSEAFDTVSSLKKSLLTPKIGVDAAPLPAKYPLRHKAQEEPNDGEEDDPEFDEGMDEESGPVFDVDHGQDFAEDDDHVYESFSFKNPWVIAICALLVTAVSTGIAVGALCHARIGTQARDPLLSTLLQAEAASRIPAEANSGTPFAA